jgi:hypothetical protein
MALGRLAVLAPTRLPSVASSAKRPQKQRIEGGGRVTPKGGSPAKRKVDGSSSSEGSGRYTPPIPSHYRESGRAVPIIMFTFFAVGMLVIFLHYVDLILPGAGSNWWLMVGLVSILGGIITATQYR